MKRIRGLIAVLVGVGVACALQAADEGFANASGFKADLKSVPPAEMPAKAAQIVASAKDSARTDVTIGVVTAALEVSPTAAPAVVGAIAGKCKDVAATAAGTAASLQPKQAAAIARAAAAAAPSKTRQIVLAVCKAAPAESRNVAIEVAKVVPSAARDVVEAFGDIIPSLKPAIHQVLAKYNGKVPSVVTVIDEAVQLANSEPAATTASATAASRGPRVGPPYWPLPRVPTNVPPPFGGEVPPGGRNYARP